MTVDNDVDDDDDDDDNLVQVNYGVDFIQKIIFFIQVVM